jgi:hypothetical protein
MGFKSVIAIGLMVILSVSCEQKKPEKIAVPLTQEVYLWQRKWTPEVIQAVEGVAQDFRGLCFLAAEARVDVQRQTSDLLWFDVDWESLRKLKIPISAAVRLGSPRGDLSRELKQLREAATRLQAASQQEQVALREIQIDLDAPSSLLGAYADLVEKLRAEFPHLKWNLTALPDWLSRRDFPRLAKAAGSYILQVHALALPTQGTAETLLCDPKQAKLWAMQASKIGVPFRIALPTYASRVYFDAAGSVLDVASEDGNLNGPRGAHTMTLMRSDAALLSALVGHWTAQPPQHCEGFIWYRLPVKTDRWNWKMEGLREVMAGRAPQPVLTSKLQQNEAGFFEVYLENQSSVEVPLPKLVILSVPAPSDLIAWDAIGKWQGQLENNQLKLSNSGGWLFPQGKQSPGWLRTSAGVTPTLLTTP